MAKKKTTSKNKLTAEQQARNELTNQPVGDDGAELAEFFGDQIPNPNFGKPGEPKYIDNPNPPEYVEGEEGTQAEFKPGDTMIDPTTGEIQEFKEDGTWGDLTLDSKDVTTDDGGQRGSEEPKKESKADEDLEDELPDDDKKGESAPQMEEMQAILKQLQGIQDVIPDRLRREGDPLASIAEMVKAYANAEKKISDQGDTIKRLNALMATPSPQMDYQQQPYQPGYGYQHPGRQMSPQQASPTEEGLDVDISDDDYSMNPKEATLKTVMAALNKVGPRFANNILAQIDQREFNRFRANNPEWDELYTSGELPAILRSHRHLDNLQGMPEALEKAKELRQLRLEEQRKQLLGNTDPNAISQVSETMQQMTDTFTKNMEALQKRLDMLEKGGMAEAAEKVYSQKMKMKAAQTPQPNASGGGSAQVKKGQKKLPTQEELDTQFVKEMANSEPGQHDVEGKPVTEGAPYSEKGAKQLKSLLRGDSYHELETIG